MEVLDNTEIEEFKKEYMDKLLKVVLINDRIVMGFLTCIDNYCNLYISHSVELFNKEGDHYLNHDLFKPVKDNNDSFFSFESEKDQFQLFGPLIIPGKEIKSILMMDK